MHKGGERGSQDNAGMSSSHRTLKAQAQHLMIEIVKFIAEIPIERHKRNYTMMVLFLMTQVQFLKEDRLCF